MFMEITLTFMGQTYVLRRPAPTVFEFIKADGQSHFVEPELPHCSCNDFKYRKGPKHLVCKHILAVQMARETLR